MEWNLNTPTEWDWENLDMYGNKPIEIPKNLQFSSQEAAENVVLDDGNYSYSGSLDSSVKETVKTFGVINGFPKDSLEKEEFSWIGKHGSFSNMVEEASVLSGEAMIGLKLGRQTYSQDLSPSGSNKPTTSFPLLPTSSSPIIKRSRASYQSSQSPRCQVEGCNLDLTSAKDYHRRHRICANHSKSPKVVVAGMERRFCQQCSRFHDLSEFDDRKRSCRRRLSAHNARRRRPQSDDIQFSSTRMSSSICDRRPQMSFLMNRVSIQVPNSAPQSSCNFKVTPGKESLLSLAKGGGVDVMPNGALHMDSDSSSSFHGITPRNINHKGVEATSNSIFASDVRHAYSLQSPSSWGLNGPEEASSFDPFVHGNRIGLAQPGMPMELQTTQLQDFHSLKSPHEFECFYSN